MSESNYHGRMMNIAVVLRQMLETTTNPYLDDVETYKLGHRDARHAAAEIAAEADVRIAALDAQLAAAQERERGLEELLRRHRYTDGPRYSGGCCISCGQAYYSGCSADCDIDAALAAAQKEGSDD